MKPDTLLHQLVRGAHDLAPLTRARYLADLDAWIAFAGADPAGWTSARAQAFYDQMLDRIRPQSANRVMASLRYAAGWWAKKEGNPALNFAVVQTAKGRGKATRRALTQEEAQRLLATCGDAPGDLRDRALIVLGLETGARRMSLAAMALENVKLGRDGDPVVSVPIKGGGDDWFDVPLSDACMVAIEPWRQWLKSQKVTKGPLFRPLLYRMDARGHVQPRLGPGALSKSGIYKMVATRAQAANLGHVHPHVFRHTFVTWRVEQGLAPYEIAAITGHKIAHLPGMGGLGSYVDGSRIARTARAHTPDWLTRLVTSKRSS